MPKINVYLPDELADAVKESGVPVSAICQRALEQAVRRVSAIRETALGELDDGDLAARLPHFTARARTVLKLGVTQARSVGSAAVGSGHLLGGLLAEGGNLALQVLRALEIEPDAVSRGLARQPLADADATTAAPGTASSAATIAAADAEDGMSRRFSLPAANALELAVTEATALGHNYVGCEHLLLGLIAEPDGVAGQVLRAQGTELRLTRRAVVAALAGYVHLRAQTAQAATPGAATADPATALAAAVRQELQPLMRRVERLEERIGVSTEG